MWILPKNYQLSSRFAQGLVASKEDLSLQGLNIESSLMSKSKPTRLRTWQTRWKQGSYYPHLFGRILKPCQYSRFETELTSLHRAIHANPFQQQEKSREKKTQDISGPTLKKSSEQLDLLDASLKTSKDTLALDSEKSLKTWKDSVIARRGEYLVRMKSALLTREKEFSSWPTPTVFDVTGGNYPTELVNGHWRSKHSKDPESPWYGAKLRDAVETSENHTGLLNPEFVEWLMGYETGSTELGSAEIQ